MSTEATLIQSRLHWLTITLTVPLVVAFTKFDAQIIQEYVKLNDTKDEEDKWTRSKENADDILQRLYLAKILDTSFPPKEYVHLGGGNNECYWFKVKIIHSTDMDLPETDCHELTEKTANAIDDAKLYGLFVTTQMNNLNLCVNLALK